MNDSILEYNSQLSLTTSVDILHQKPTLFLQYGTRLFNQDLFHYFRQTLKTSLDFIVPTRSTKMAVINNDIWLISNALSYEIQQVHTYDKRGFFLKILYINDLIITDITQARNKDVFAIAKSKISKGLYILDRNYGPSYQLTRSTKVNILIGMYVNGNFLFVLQTNLRNILKVQMYSCINVLKPQTGKCVWVKKREFKFSGLKGKVNNVFIVQVQPIHNRNENMNSDADNFSFFFSSIQEVCMFDKNGQKVYTFPNPLSLFDEIINIVAIDRMNNILISKEVGYHVIELARQTWHFAMAQIAKKYDAVVDNENNAIWFLQAFHADMFGFMYKSRLFKYEL